MFRGAICGIGGGLSPPCQLCPRHCCTDELIKTKVSKKYEQLPVDLLFCLDIVSDFSVAMDSDEGKMSSTTEKFLFRKRDRKFVGPC